MQLLLKLKHVMQGCVCRHSCVCSRCHSHHTAVVPWARVRAPQHAWRDTCHWTGDWSSASSATAVLSHNWNQMSEQPFRRCPSSCAELWSVSSLLEELHTHTSNVSMRILNVSLLESRLLLHILSASMYISKTHIISGTLLHHHCIDTPQACLQAVYPSVLI